MEHIDWSQAPANAIAYCCMEDKWKFPGQWLEDCCIERPAEDLPENQSNTQDKTLVEVWYATDAQNCLEINGSVRMFYPGSKVEIYVTPPEQTQEQKETEALLEIVKLYPEYRAEDIVEMLRLKFDLELKEPKQ